MSYHNLGLSAFAGQFYNAASCYHVQHNFCFVTFLGYSYWVTVDSWL